MYKCKHQSDGLTDLCCDPCRSVEVFWEETIRIVILVIWRCGGQQVQVHGEMKKSY